MHRSTISMTHLKDAIVRGNLLNRVKRLKVLIKLRIELKTLSEKQAIVKDTERISISIG